MKTFDIGNLKISAVTESARRICYVLYPFGGLEEWMSVAARKNKVSVAVITGMDWNDNLTPWPANGEPPGSPDFKGLAAAFLSTLAAEAVPRIERELKMEPGPERTLAGVSLSGLFTLWQWIVNGTFHNIISLSGSFWYDGFVAWLKAQPFPEKTGKAYFLLGDREAHTNVKAFQPVQSDTVEIADYLRTKGVDVLFELVPGNHYQYGEQRLDRAFTRMFLSEKTV